MRRFELHRQVDVSGVSGTGVVAQGVQFTDGTVVIRWFGEHASTVNWASIEHAERVHGHGGATRFVWLDADPAAARKDPKSDAAMDAYDDLYSPGWRQAQECGTCHAQPGHPCREADGREAQVPHRVRRWRG